ncbi:hypothetical protein [Actinoplanes rectilineatus]|uniref:hypothetical protein n=1 Tax=Actinoplanes rectilineatus TaxID=113571 RepID=UPI0005F280D8|nr:hypothetical protein [Actinoplanes rectilineatus]
MTNTLTVTTPHYRITIHPSRGAMPGPAPRVFVDQDVAEGRDPELADLGARERALGNNRNLRRGLLPAIDDLYDQYNAAIGRVKTAIAQETLVFLASDVTGDVDAAVEGAVFDRNAGCQACPCTPGVTAGARLSWRGEPFYVDVTSH